ncbi:hypothetical protein [Prochlorococcus marinus]|uniref:Uncharacterized protein n=1 Tax=Prochlorococcus marinus XMU1408 TaxID=2213228 RepID=A0A318R2A9_PROMR|nr:hypothetical protein [Prochlorococcus marinus]MBW3042321.1 hypothetical protein [Prochlorococcus marinus str. XMU1408]PYE01706.1 hypothetical protein DNJ73_06395 [Prochlorococcus marinus XMU1408]
MNQNFQALVQEATKDNSSTDQTFLFGGALLFFNLFVMLFVGMYWMNPEMHEFISGRPLL